MPDSGNTEWSLAPLCTGVADKKGVSRLSASCGNGDLGAVAIPQILHAFSHAVSRHKTMRKADKRAQKSPHCVRALRRHAGKSPQILSARARISRPHKTMQQAHSVRRYRLTVSVGKHRHAEGRDCDNTYAGAGLARSLPLPMLDVRTLGRL